VFTPDLMAEVLEAFMEQKAVKQAWDAASAAEYVQDVPEEHYAGGGYSGIAGLHTA
jgi:hypothetical protein